MWRSRIPWPCVPQGAFNMPFQESKKACCSTTELGSFRHLRISYPKKNPHASWISTKPEEQAAVLVGGNSSMCVLEHHGVQFSKLMTPVIRPNQYPKRLGKAFHSTSFPWLPARNEDLQLVVVNASKVQVKCKGRRPLHQLSSCI